METLNLGQEESAVASLDTVCNGYRRPLRIKDRAVPGELVQATATASTAPRSSTNT